jgi:hypothetical protein
VAWCPHMLTNGVRSQELREEHHWLPRKGRHRRGTSPAVLQDHLRPLASSLLFSWEASSIRLPRRKRMPSALFSGHRLLFFLRSSCSLIQVTGLPIRGLDPDLACQCNSLPLTGSQRRAWLRPWWEPWGREQLFPGMLRGRGWD